MNLKVLKISRNLEERLLMIGRGGMDAARAGNPHS